MLDASLLQLGRPFHTRGLLLRVHLGMLVPWRVGESQGDPKLVKPQRPKHTYSHDMFTSYLTVEQLAQCSSGENWVYHLVEGDYSEFIHELLIPSITLNVSPQLTSYFFFVLRFIPYFMVHFIVRGGCLGLRSWGKAYLFL